ncbi:hypothetical protein V8C34DRAFT_285237 [Trichoderma compactum]
MSSGGSMVPVVKLLQDVSRKCPNTCACIATLTSTPQRPINLTIHPCPKGNVLVHIPSSILPNQNNVENRWPSGVLKARSASLAPGPWVKLVAVTDCFVSGGIFSVP